VRLLHVGWGFTPLRPGGLIAYAEDLMDRLAERGHEVSYFCSGRHYPFTSGPRLKRWRRGRVAMHEVINPPIITGLDRGTRFPEADLGEPRMEAAFERLLDRVRPDVVHIQELHGLPSSLIDLCAAAGVPTLMTLQDYFPLCTTLRLFDADGRICMRREVGADCVANNAQAPTDFAHSAGATLQFDIDRVRSALHVPEFVDFSLLAPAIGRAKRGLGALRQRDRAAAVPAPAREAAPAGPDPSLASAYQRRRDVNVERLGRVDRLVAQSPRVAEIYTTLGVSGERMQTLQFTLSHIERLTQRRLDAPPSPVTFATLNGCTAPTKGSRVVRDALRALRAAGLDGRYRLLVFGVVERAIHDELEADPAVELRGQYERDELDGLLDEVDVGIMPSIWEEAFGYTGTEMVAKGIPLIANPLGGIVEYALEGETAWWNRSCSGEELGAIMAELIEQPQRVLDMHRSTLAARDRLVLPMDRHVDAIEALYADLRYSSTVR
jgi:glycosyltransferase involved in cell wall biosynthesis